MRQQWFVLVQILAMFAGVPLLSEAAASAPVPAAPRLRVDPRLLVEVRTVWSVVASPANPIWPGWNAADTPVLVYLPNVQDALVHHPHPPEGFVPYPGRTPFEDGAVWLRDGPTTIAWDGQNTSTEVGGVPTLVIADTPSTLRQKLRGWMNDPRPPETKLAELDLEGDLAADPYDEMTRIAHEAFHVFQKRASSRHGADERDVRLYPCLSVENNVGVALEGKALAAALRATDPAAVRRAAVRWLAIRRDRRAKMPGPAAAYEDGNEFSEGLAMYVELALLRALEGRPAGDSLWLYQGFHGFADLSVERERKIQGLLGNMRGEVNVNNDRFGTAPVRRRLYYSGMAIAALLDRVQPGWKAGFLADSVSLTDMAERALHPTARERAAALAEAKRDTEYASLVAAKTRLAADGRRDTDSLLASIMSSAATRVVFDYAALGPRPKMGLSFTGFGVRAIDTLRTIYTLVPIGMHVASMKNGFEQTVPLPTLEDRGASRFTFPLERPLTEAEVREVVASAERALASRQPFEAKLPGATVSAQRARVEAQGSTLLVRLLPND